MPIRRQPADDGLPSTTLATTWSVVSGPGAVTFGGTTVLNTASFSVDGVYTLRLTADDGALTATDDVIITVDPAPPTNQAPTANAGSDQNVTLPSIAILSGTASDDEAPSAMLATAWAWSADRAASPLATLLA
ncbi:MAG: hypothetical protein R2911_15105 [Caldilineaceae bacterium]